MTADERVARPADVRETTRSVWETTKGAGETTKGAPREERPSPARSSDRYLLLPDEPELPERPDDPDEPDEPDDPDDPDEPDEPDEALRPDCPLLLEPDIPPESCRLPEEPELPELPALPELPELPDLPELLVEPLMLPGEEELPDAFRSLPCEPDDDPALPPTPPVLEPLDEECRSRSDAE